jgi:hypothetical protein
MITKISPKTLLGVKMTACHNIKKFRHFQDNTTSVSDSQDISIRLIIGNLKHTTVNNSRGVNRKIEDMDEEDSGNKNRVDLNGYFFPILQKPIDSASSFFPIASGKLFLLLKIAPEICPISRSSRHLQARY